MNEQRFTQLLGGIDPALIARAEAPVPMRKKPRFRRAMVAAIAALLAMSLLLGASAIALIPRTYDLDYEIPKQENASKVAQIYYLSGSGKIKRQSVLLPPTEQNVFMTWAHLNGLGDEYALINIASSEGDPADRHVIITLSTELGDHPNAQSLLASLQKTFAKFFEMHEENVLFSFGRPGYFFPTSSPALGEFRQFMNTYGLSSADPATFKQGVMQCTVNGVGVFDLMIQKDLELAPGYRGESWSHDQMSYSYTQFTENKFIQTYENYFEITGIPDGMILPCSITPKDSLYAALEKIGADKKVFDLFSSSEPWTQCWLAMAFEEDLFVTYQPSEYYTITYKRGRNGLSSSLFPDYESLFVMYYSIEDQSLYKISVMVKDNCVCQPAFREVSLDTSSSDCIMLPDLAAHFSGVFNSHSWERDSANSTTPALTFDCDGIQVHYAKGEFFTEGYYWFADGYTRDCTNALLEAITQLNAGKYDGVLYHAGEYYGHNAEVNRTHQGSAGYTGKENLLIDTHAFVVGYSPTVSSAPDYRNMSGTRFEVYSDYLVTEDGIYFEKFTEIAPEFNKSTVVLRESPYTNRSIQLSGDNLLLVRDVFSRTDISGYTADDANSDPTVTYNTIFKVNDYTIEYDPASGKARIGHWKLSVSEQDRIKLLELLELCSAID